MHCGAGHLEEVYDRYRRVQPGALSRPHRWWAPGAEIVLDVDDPFLGGTAPSTLVRAGHIQAHDPGAATLADTLFRAERSPHCLHWF